LDEDVCLPRSTEAFPGSRAKLIVQNQQQDITQALLPKLGEGLRQPFDQAPERPEKPHDFSEGIRGEELFLALL
jgi:hypothetical protein